MIKENIPELDCVSLVSVDVVKDVLVIMYLKLHKSFVDDVKAAFSFSINPTEILFTPAALEINFD